MTSTATVLPPGMAFGNQSGATGSATGSGGVGGDGGVDASGGRGIGVPAGMKIEPSELAAEIVGTEPTINVGFQGVLLDADQREIRAEPNGSFQCTVDDPAIAIISYRDDPNALYNVQGTSVGMTKVRVHYLRDGKPTAIEAVATFRVLEPQGAAGQSGGGGAGEFAGAPGQAGGGAEVAGVAGQAGGGSSVDASTGGQASGGGGCSVAPSGAGALPMLTFGLAALVGAIRTKRR